MSFRRRLGVLLILPLMLPLAAFQLSDPQPVPAPDQPLSERSAQGQLPQSNDPLWTKLATAKTYFNEKTGYYSINITPEVKSMDGADTALSGFILPLDGSDETRHFLLSKRTPVCLYCPPGEPNEVVEVRSKRPVAWIDDQVTVKGRFKLVNDGEKAIFFALNDAELVK